MVPTASEASFPSLRAAVVGNAAAEAELAVLLALPALVAQLQARVAKLETELAALKTNSQTSSKPPGSDRCTRHKPQPRSLREKSGRLPGGQPGHPGHHLAPVSQPDEVVTHPVPAECPACQGDLSAAAPLLDAAGEPLAEVRQVVELTPPRRHVVEHRALRVLCPHCGVEVREAFPPGVHGPVCYGSSVQAAVVYLSVSQLLPSHRLAEVMGELCGCPLSPGSVEPMVQRCGTRAQPVLAEIKERLLKEPWLSFDETGLSLKGAMHWLHTASSPRYTALHVHARRGSEGIKAGGLIESFKGIAVHDFLSACLKLAGRHSLCNAHHLRELRFLHEVDGQGWAAEMMEFLREAKKVADEREAGGPEPSQEQLIEMQDRYLKILDRGYADNPEPPPKAPGQRGRPARGKALNLIDRFVNRQEEVMAFLLSEAPFDNNHAERDLRMMKTRQKISGCFRSESLLGAFGSIRSVVATAAKNSVQALSAIKALLVPSPTLHSILKPASQGA